MADRCFWCNTDPDEAAKRHEGPHATWCLKYRRPVLSGFDLSNGVETHVEGFWEDGVLHITDRYEIVDGSYSTKEGKADAGN